MKVLSWNIFYYLTDLHWRTRKIAEISNLENPDIICFQEVLPETGLILLDVLKNYNSLYKTPSENNSLVREYGEMIFVKKEINIMNKFFVELPSKQGRTCTFVDLHYEGDIIRIATAHLESLQQNDAKRIDQVNKIKEELIKVDNWIWIGDSNFEYTPEGFCNFKEPTWHQSRFWDGSDTKCYDKILTNMNVGSFRLVGNEQICGKWLSDHDGIIIDVL